jgi:hypothetical protein
MIWLFFETLTNDGSWAFTFRNGEIYAEEVRNLPKGAKIISIGI